MKITNLEETPIQEIVDCLTESFKGYYVKVPSSVDYWGGRFGNARVDKKLSWGAFSNGQLVGFIMNAIDDDQGKLTAYNACTGVVEHYRGRGLVSKMYEVGLPELKARGVTHCILEVIDLNEKAIRAYEKVGFKAKRKLKCYNGTLWQKGNVWVVEVKMESVANKDIDARYSWDNKMKTIKKAESAYATYEVIEKDSGLNAGYFIINPTDGSVVQLEAKNGNWTAVFDGISQINKEVRINNVDEERKELIGYLSDMGLVNPINQYEMELKL